MSIFSFNFMLFVALALAVYYLLSRRWQNYWLLFISYVFCVTWAWQFALTLAILTLVNFVLVRQLQSDTAIKRRLLWLGIGFNILVLAFFRSVDFFLPELSNLLARFGIATQSDGLKILVPIGLSYYILEIISYLIDTYRGQTTTSSLSDFALYLAYFPKLVAGPIERARTFLPKLAEPRIVDNQVLIRSFTLISVGIARKILVADLLAAAILPDVFETPQLYTAPELWGWLILYGFSLYNDFAGYTSIVRGVSGLFGLELSSNFQHPYFARSFTEFWNRWHITLSHWLRDYIYFPLSRILLRRNPSRRNLANLVIPPLITMLVSGLWHGFDAHMFLWGGLHGLYQILERLPSLWRPITPPQLQPAWRQAASTVLIVFLIMLAWVPFRMEVPVALEFWRGLFDLSSSAFRFRRILLFAPVIIAAVAFDWLQHHYNDEYIVLRWPRLAQAACLAAMVWFIFVLLPADGGEPFVYQGF